MFSCNNTEVRSLSHYEGAKHLFDNRKPWRGLPTNEVHLGNRRHRHKVLVKYDAHYAARLYRTDVLEVHKDGAVVVRLGGYDTQFTRSFLNQASPGWMSFYSRRGQTWVQVRDVDGEAHSYYLSGKHPLRFVNRRPVELHPLFTQRINRAAAKEVRGWHRELRAMLKVYMAANPTWDLSVGPSFLPHVRQLDMVDTPEEWALLAMYLIRCSTVRRDANAGSLSAWGSSMRARSYDPKNVMHRLDALLFAKHPQVYDDIPVPQSPVAGE